MQWESREQETLIAWCRFEARMYPELDMIFHIPNGGSRNRLEAYNLKKQGVKPGVPDLCLPVARSGYHGLYIEMKHGKNKTTDYQEEWIKKLNKEGYRAVVCRGFEEAKKEILRYIKGGVNE